MLVVVVLVVVVLVVVVVVVLFVLLVLLVVVVAVVVVVLFCVNATVASRVSVQVHQNKEKNKCQLAGILVGQEKGNAATSQIGI